MKYDIQEISIFSNGACSIDYRKLDDNGQLVSRVKNDSNLTAEMKGEIYRLVNNLQNLLLERDNGKNRYSDVILTDDNFDEEIEKLSEKIGIPFANYDGFVKKLDKGFVCQEHDLGFAEWIFVENKCTPGSESSYQKCQLAYEFGNGFIIMHNEEPV